MKAVINGGDKCSFREILRKNSGEAGRSPRRDKASSWKLFNKFFFPLSVAAQFLPFFRKKPRSNDQSFK